MQRGYARTEERNAQIRASLQPLEPGERPGAVTVAAVIAALLAVTNVALAIAGVEVGGQEPSIAGGVLFTAIMLVAAWGMWHGRYWAVLGFQALLALTIVIAALSLMFASNVAGALFAVAIVLPGGYLFWKLIRAMARLQMPERPGAAR